MVSAPGRVGGFSSTHAGAGAQPQEWWEAWAAQSEDGRAQRTFGLVAADGRWVGMTVVRLGDDAPGSAVVTAMWVAPEARGHGAAALLSDACAAWAVERGCDALALNVVVANDGARRAYEAAGFAVRSRSTWARSGGTRDEFVMTRSLERPRR